MLWGLMNSGVWGFGALFSGLICCLGCVLCALIFDILTCVH